MEHTKWSRRAVEAVRSGLWTDDDFVAFCERAGKGAELHDQERADLDAWFETSADVAERSIDDGKKI